MPDFSPDDQRQHDAQLLAAVTEHMDEKTARAKAGLGVYAFVGARDRLLGSGKLVRATEHPVGWGLRKP